MNKSLDEFVTFLAEARFESVPSSVVEAAKDRLLDTIGAALAALKADESIISARLVAELGGAPEAVVIGRQQKAPCAHAAFANAVCAHATELDDVHRAGILHPGAVIVPAALAVAEKAGADGRRLLLSIILGYEVAIRAAKAVNPSHRARGFHATGTCGTLGAAVAAAVNLGQGKATMGNTLALAASQAAGLLEFKEMTKRLNPGRAAFSGVLAALLASRGFTGTVDVLDVGGRFFQAFSDAPRETDPYRGIGSSYQILESSIKLHSCCGYFHSAIDGVIKIMRTNNLAATDIREIRVRTFANAMDGHLDPAPDTLVGATMSMPYSVAAAACFGNASPAAFGGEARRDPLVRTVARRVRVEVSAAMESLFPGKWGAEVEIETTDGRVMTTTVDSPRGTFPGAPLSSEELSDKFRRVSSEAVRGDVAERIISVVRNIENASSVRPLTSLLE